MNIDELAEENWQKENLENDSVYRHIYLLAFKKGFENGYSMPKPNINNILAYESGLKSNKGLFETICMQCRINAETYFILLDQFINNQKIVNKIYSQESEVNLHWMNWVKKESKRINENRSRTTDGGRL